MRSGHRSSGRARGSRAAALTDFACGEAHHRFCVRVIGRWPIKHLDTKGSFLQSDPTCLPTCFRRCIAAAQDSVCCCRSTGWNHLLQLTQDCISFLRALRLPCFPV